MNAWAVALALAAGLCFGVTSALQHRAARREAAHPIGDPRLLVRLLRSPSWLASNLLDGLAIALQAFALRAGSLTLVQPLLISGLVFAVPAEAALRGRHPSRRDLLGAVLGCGGLAAFLASGTTTAGIDKPAISAWLFAAGVMAPLVIGCLAYAHRTDGAPRAASIGAASGLLYGFTAALLKTCSSDLTHPLTLLTNWPIYALVALGGVGFVLNQSMFQHGSLAAGLVTLSIIEPIAASALGATIFSEHPHLEPARAVLLCLALGALLASVVLVVHDQVDNHPHVA